MATQWQLEGDLHTLREIKSACSFGDFDRAFALINDFHSKPMRIAANELCAEWEQSTRALEQIRANTR